MKFTLPELKFSKEALEPYIDQMTMEIHHQKHHGTYITNLNAALEGKSEYEDWSIEKLLMHLSELPDDIQAAVRNNGGGHYNHSLFWDMLTPGGKPMSMSFEAKLIETFGSVDQFKANFKEAALKRFGSGWAWLVVSGGKLKIVSTPNQDAPISEGYHEILGLDVWEHAYYLNYQNKRADYVDAFWHVVDWSVVEKRFEAAQ